MNTRSMPGKALCFSRRDFGRQSAVAKTATPLAKVSRRSVAANNPLGKKIGFAHF